MTSVVLLHCGFGDIQVISLCNTAVVAAGQEMETVDKNKQNGVFYHIWDQIAMGMDNIGYMQTNITAICPLQNAVILEDNVTMFYRMEYYVVSGIQRLHSRSWKENNWGFVEGTSLINYCSYYFYLFCVSLVQNIKCFRQIINMMLISKWSCIKYDSFAKTLISSRPCSYCIKKTFFPLWTFVSTKHIT